MGVTLIKHEQKLTVHSMLAEVLEYTAQMNGTCNAFVSTVSSTKDVNNYNNNNNNNNKR